MFSHRLSNLVGTALVASAFGLLTILTGTGTASAASVDAIFVDILADKGIAFDSVEQAAGDGQLVCAQLDEGSSPVAIIDQVLHDTDLSEDQAVYLVAASVVTYCPEYRT